MMHLLRFLSVIIGLMTATSALALAPCGDTVVDTAGVLSNEPALERAAAALEQATGAMVRVRISEDFTPQSSLDAHVRQVWTSVCPDWRNSQGDLKSDGIVLWVATKGEIGFYYGSRWSGRLRPAEDSVFDTMMPDLNDGNFDEAVRAGLDRVSRIISVATVTLRATDPTSSKPAPIVVPAVKSEPVDMRPFLALIAGLILSVLLFFVLRTGYRHWVSAQREEAERQTAQLAAITAFNAVGEVSLSAGAAVSRVSKAIVAAEAVSSPEHIAKWQEALRTGNGEIERLRGKFNAPTDPNKAGLPLKAYNDAKTAFEHLLPEYEAVRDDLIKLAEDIEKIPALATAMPEALDDLQFKTVSAVGQLIANLERDGFVTTGPDTILKAGEAVVGEMRSAIEARDWGLASDRLAEARLKFNEAREAAESLPLRRDQATKRLAALRQLLSSYQTHKDAGVAAADTLVRQYTPDCFALVAGNVTKADDLEQQLEGGLSALEQLVASQNWDVVEKQLEAAEDAADDIGDLFAAITERLQRLDEMVEDAEAEVVEASRSIAAVRTYLIRETKYNTKDNKAKVQKLQSDLDQVPKLEKGKPLPVVERLRLAAAVDDAADALLAAIEARVADDIARTERAKRLLRDIAERINEYDRYAMLHRGDIPSTIIDDLNAARSDYDQLEQVSSVDERLARGAALGQLLDSFYTGAKRAVSDAEDERRRAREAAEAAALAARRKRDAAQRAAEAARRRDDDDDGPSFGGSIGFGQPSRSSYGSSSGFGGGSRSFGISSSGMGGGSRSFGSGMGGGSRSFGGR